MVWQWKLCVPTGTETRSFTGAWPFRNKSPCIATLLKNDEQGGFRRSLTHTCKSNWSVPVHACGECDIVCDSSQQRSRKQMTKGFIISLCDTQFHGNGHHRWIELNIWSKHRALDTVLHDHWRSRPSHAHLLKICLPSCHVHQKKS